MSNAMLFVIFTISVVVIELIVRHDARQRAKSTSAAPDTSVDLLRLAQALDTGSQNAPGPRIERLEQPATAAEEAEEVMVRRSR
jgi:hypothetical protein